MVRSYNNLYHGWINLYKDSGLTSNDALRLIKSTFNGSKIGHAGTLDPMAKGILPIALGEATKTIPYIHEKNKTYLFYIISLSHLSEIFLVHRIIYFYILLLVLQYYTR